MVHPLSAKKFNSDPRLSMPIMHRQGPVYKLLFTHGTCVAPALVMPKILHVGDFM